MLDSPALHGEPGQRRDPAPRPEPTLRPRLDLGRRLGPREVHSSLVTDEHSNVKVLSAASTLYGMKTIVLFKQ